MSDSKKYIVLEEFYPKEFLKITNISHENEKYLFKSSQLQIAAFVLNVELKQINTTEHTFVKYKVCLSSEKMFNLR